ncbi:hypothetical protein K2173_011145 [Erythroxylum novogranatense]|uniref:Pentatricopeptide repeat-containing protein n=1 Tax=Erythroxylum novogranatense TaxID=1862640 RepID=A0AAV8U9P5_9ROSI|nr:hypothetical protein K2173_011145 [Erythroxylum novogranatense]
MEIARTLSHLNSAGPCLARRLCTAAEKMTSPKAGPRRSLDRVYRRLSALPATLESVTKTLNDYESENGKCISKSELVRCIKELRRYRRFHHALEIMSWMENKKMNLSSGDHAVRLDLIAKSNGITAAESYFAGMSPAERGFSTYGTLLNCYCTEVWPNKALALFAKMHIIDILLYALPFNNFMSLHLRLGHPQRIQAIYHEMKRRNVPPCTLTYNLLMQSYGCLNDIEGVERIFEEMKRDRVVCLDWSSYSNLAAIYVKAGNVVRAESALRMLERKMPPNSREAHHFLIGFYAKTSNAWELNRVWDSLKSRFSVVTNADYLVMLRGLAKLNDIRGFMRCFKEWESVRVSFDRRIVSFVLRVYLEHDMYEEAVLIFDDALRRTGGPLFKAREMFMVFFLRADQLDMALNHLKEAFSTGEHHRWQPKPETVKAFLTYFKGKKDVDGAERFCAILKHINCLNSDACSLLLSTYVAAGRMAPDMCRRLEQNGI